MSKIFGLREVEICSYNVQVVNCFVLRKKIYIKERKSWAEPGSYFLQETSLVEANLILHKSIFGNVCNEPGFSPGFLSLAMGYV